MRLKNLVRVFVAPLMIAVLTLAGCAPKVQTPEPEKLGAGFYAGQLSVLQPTYQYTMNFTATSQTVKQVISGLGSATIQLSGVATVATITCKGSVDGTNWYGLDYSDGTITATYNTVKSIAAGAWSYSGTPTLYYVNFAGFNQVECVTSSTFTGAAAAATITASNARGIF
jgi:hypothetical protein